MRTATNKSNAPAAGNSNPRFKCSETLLLRLNGGSPITAQCLEIGEDSVLIELEEELTANQPLTIEIPTQRIRREGKVVSCSLEMGMFHAELVLSRGHVFDPIAITMYPLLHAR